MAVGGLSLVQCVGAQIFFGGGGVVPEPNPSEIGSVISWSESPNRATGGGTQNDSLGRSRTIEATRAGDLATMDVVVNFLPGNANFRKIYEASRDLSKIFLDFRAAEILLMQESSQTIEIDSGTGEVDFASPTELPDDLAIGQSLKVGNNYHEIVRLTANPDDAKDITGVFVRPFDLSSPDTYSVVQAPMATGMHLFQVLTAPAIGDMTSDENAVYRGTIAIQPIGDWPQMAIPVPS